MMLGTAHCCVYRAKNWRCPDYASAAYLICSDVDYLVSKLKRYSKFHGSGSYIDVSCGTSVMWFVMYLRTCRTSICFCFMQLDFMSKFAQKHNTKLEFLSFN